MNRNFALVALWLAVGCKDAPAEPGFAPHQMGARDSGTSSGNAGGARDGGTASGSTGGTRATVGSMPDSGPSGGSSGTGSGSGSAPTDSHFDPDEMYIIGQHLASSCIYGIANIETRDHAVSGLNCGAEIDRAQINPATGDLLYFDREDQVVRAFRCDNGCKEFVAGDVGRHEDKSNDPIIETPECDPQHTLNGFRVSAEGDVLPLCDNDLYYSNGHYSGLSAAVGHGFICTARELINLADGTSTSFTGLEPTGVKMAVRTSSAGFLLAFAGRADADPPTLWAIDTSGAAKKLGTYPSFPDGWVSTGNAVLAVDGTLYAPARTTDPDFAFYRFAVNGSGEAEPALTGTLASVSSELVTGP